MLVLEIGLYMGDGRDFGLSVVIETDYGAVIDLWGDYFEDESVADALIKLLSDAFIVISKAKALDTKELLFRVPAILVNQYIEGEAEFYRLVSRLKKELLSKDTSFKVSIVSKNSMSRAYSLAKKTYSIKRRYPPQIPV